MSDCDVTFNPVRLIEEVRKRPGLYDQSSHPLDREEKLALWKEVGAVLCPKWDSYDRAAAYDRGGFTLVDSIYTGDHSEK